MVLKHSVILEPGITRREALKVGALATASAIFGKYLLESEARADKKNGNGNGNGKNGTEKNGNGKNGKYKTVSLEDMKRWDKETKRYRKTPDIKDDESFSTGIRITYANLVIIVSGVVNYKNVNKSGVGVALYKQREANPFFEKDLIFDKVPSEFKSELKSLKLVVEEGYQDGIGKYVQLWVVPNKEIKPGILVLPVFAYTQGKIGRSDTPLLVASAK